MSKPLLILGVGSPWGDDQVAWWVIDVLAEYSLPNVVLEKLDRPGLRLIPYFQKSEHIIVIDAALSQKTTGVIHHVDSLDALVDLSLMSSHSVGVAESLKLANTVHQLPQCWEIYAITVDPNEAVGQSELNVSIHNVAMRIRDLINRL